MLKTLLGLSKVDIFQSGRGSEVSEDNRVEFLLKSHNCFKMCHFLLMQKSRSAVVLKIS